MTLRRQPSPGPVYALADVGILGGENLAPAVAAMAEAGISWIQIRAKRAPDEMLYRWLSECFEAVAPSGAELWMDDRADVAALFPFSGLHLGQRDLPPRAARRVVGERMWIGVSTHNRDQLETAVDDPEVDVVAVGPIFPTTGKEGADPVVGLDALRYAREATRKTLVAIGGIDAHNLAAVLEAGADSVAVLGAVCRGDVAAAARELVAAAEAKA